VSISVLDAIGPQPLAPEPARPTPSGSPGLQGDFHRALEALLNSQRGEERPVAARPLRFSRHAQSRLASRDIELDPSQLERLGQAVDQLDDKGAQESLVVLDDHAFIVGVQKRTVITAMSRTEAVGNIFTQIDSTLFVP